MEGSTRPDPPAVAGRRRRTRTLLVLSPFLLLFLCCSSCVTFVWHELGACPEDLRLDVLGPIDDRLSITPAEDERACGSELTVRSDGRGPGELSELLVGNLTANGWSMAETDAGWSGRRTVAGETFEVDVYAEWPDLPPWTDSRGYLDITLSQHDSAPTVDTTVPPMAGPLLRAPRFVGGTLVALTSDHVIGFDPVDVTRRWVSPACPHADWASPLPTPPIGIVVVRCGGALIGIDPTDGTTRWQRVMPVFQHTRMIGDTVVLSGEMGAFAALDATNGTPLIDRPAFGGAMGSADDHAIYTATDDGVTAFDRATGAQRWHVSLPSSAVRADDGDVYVRTNDHRVVRLDGEDGQTRWTSDVEASRLDSSDIIGLTDDTVVLWSGERTDVITVYDQSTGVELWQKDASSGEFHIAVVGADRLALVGGRSHALLVTDDRTGAEVRRLDGTDGALADISGDRVAFVQLVDGRRVLRSEPIG